MELDIKKSQLNIVAQINCSNSKKEKSKKKRKKIKICTKVSLSFSFCISSSLRSFSIVISFCALLFSIYILILDWPQFMAGFVDFNRDNY